MNPEMYLVIYQQHERELMERLNRRTLQTCCGPAATARRSARVPLGERISSLRVGRQAAVCCPA